MTTAAICIRPPLHFPNSVLKSFKCTTEKVNYGSYLMPYSRESQRLGVRSNPCNTLAGPSDNRAGDRYNFGMKKYIVLLLLCLTGSISSAYAKTPGEVEIGGFLREAHLQGLSGPDKQLAAYRGKPLVINVWASWCGPCRDEMGSLQRLAQRYGGKQFNVIGISTDDYREPALAFLRESGTTFPNYIDSKLFMENMLGAERIPLTLLVDAKGKVLEKFYGAHAWDSPEALEVISKAFRIKL